jgi:hypothetical protein
VNIDWGTVSFILQKISNCTHNGKLDVDMLASALLEANKKVAEEQSKHE